jgi:hypothetical protein
MEKMFDLQYFFGAEWESNSKWKEKKNVLQQNYHSYCWKMFKKLFKLTPMQDPAFVAAAKEFIDSNPKLPKTYPTSSVLLIALLTISSIGMNFVFIFPKMPNPLH